MAWMLAEDRCSHLSLVQSLGAGNKLQRLHIRLVAGQSVVNQGVLAKLAVHPASLHLRTMCTRTVCFCAHPLLPLRRRPCSRMRRDAIAVHDQVAHPPHRKLVIDEAEEAKEANEANNSSSKHVAQCENGCAHYILNLSKQLPLQMIATVTIQSLNTRNNNNSIHQHKLQWKLYRSFKVM